MDTRNFQELTSSNKMVAEKDEFQEFFQTLDKESSWDGCLMGCYKGFWFDADLLQAMISFERYFQAKETDIIVASLPKSGTTWLKALTFSIANRGKHSAADSPLLSSNPHELIPFFELHLYKEGEIPELNSMKNPRIFSTHIPYQILPDSILDSKCKIVYIARSPLDVFISDWHFSVENQFGSQQQPLAIDEAFELFCKGINFFSPFWDHMLAYWNASLKNPERVLLLKYEDLKMDIVSSVKKIANFLGFSFSEEEEKNGLTAEIIRLCSFENLKNLEVNKNGETATLLKAKHSSFFRKAEVGDSANYLTPSMVERLKKLMEEKFAGSGLSFATNYKSSC